MTTTRRLSTSREFPNANFPLLKLTSGHIALQFYSMTEKEGGEAARYLLENGSTSFDEVIHYVQSVNDPKIEYVLLNKINLDDNFLKNK